MIMFNRTLYSIHLKALTFFLFIFCQFSCKKILEEKPDKAKVVPTSANDFQALLDSYQSLNLDYPSLQEVLCDDYYITDIPSKIEFDNYVWKAVENDANFLQWKQSYYKVNTCNIILEGLSPSTVKDQEVYGNIQGQALFFRAFVFHNQAQLFCKPYSATADQDLGIPLVLSSDVETKTFRSTVKQTYEQIINDLKTAVHLLPVIVPAASRPSRAAAYGLLARTYLSIGDYANAGLYADSSLQLNSSLIDFNTLDSTANSPIARFNAETIFYSSIGYFNITSYAYAKIDSAIHSAYDQNDLRSVIFCKPNEDGSFQFKGSYDGTSQQDAIFNGIAVDEMLLIRAESYAKAGNASAAMNDLNTLLEKRWKAGLFIPLVATDAASALQQIRMERRKELLFRGLRWSDIRRLNEEGEGIAISRDFEGTIYVLPPGDLRSVVLLPYDVVKITGMPQNPR
jgi:hypothetical protein